VQDDQRSHAHAGFVISAISVSWTVVVSGLAVGIGVHARSSVLTAFGAVGAVDAIGSIALVYHFHHARRHDRLSARLEAVAHRLVLGGLFVVGIASVLVGAARLLLGEAGRQSMVGVALAAFSLVALLVLSRRKLAVARRVRSNALRSDAHLSAIGATQAGVALLGTAAALWTSWPWADAAGTVIVGTVAAILAAATWHRGVGGHGPAAPLS
jgi:divalent metal cation (Fe/Co/Zn/Cd) transporter